MKLPIKSTVKFINWVLNTALNSTNLPLYGRTQRIRETRRRVSSGVSAKNGYIILATNWTFQKAEVDIIAQKEPFLL
jgi:hypothetical protein